MMFLFIWLLSVSLAAWVAHEIAEAEFSRGIDVILGVLSAALLRYVCLQLHPPPEPINVLLFSVWAAAASPALMRLFVLWRLKLALTRQKRFSTPRQ